MSGGRPRLVQAIKDEIEIVPKVDTRATCGRRQRTQHDIGTFGQRAQTCGHQGTQTALDGVACDRVADLLADHERDPRRITLRPGPQTTMGEDGAGSRTASSPDGCPNVVARAQAMGCAQHRTASTAQADRRARPLRRRSPRIARPARVRIRRRKPCLRARRRLFGWKVRFVTGVLPIVSCLRPQAIAVIGTGRSLARRPPPADVRARLRPVRRHAAGVENPRPLNGTWSLHSGSNRPYTRDAPHVQDTRREPPVAP